MGGPLLRVCALAALHAMRWADVAMSALHAAGASSDGRQSSAPRSTRSPSARNAMAAAPMVDADPSGVRRPSSSTSPRRYRAVAASSRRDEELRSAFRSDRRGSDGRAWREGGAVDVATRRDVVTRRYSPVLTTDRARPTHSATTTTSAERVGIVASWWAGNRYVWIIVYYRWDQFRRAEMLP